MMQHHMNPGYTILYYVILCYTILYYTVLYCTILYYTVLYCTILYYTILYYTILYYTILYYTILYYTILYYTILYYTILYYTILYYTILYYTILYYTILYYTILYYTFARVFGCIPKMHTGLRPCPADTQAPGEPVALSLRRDSQCWASLRSPLGGCAQQKVEVPANCRYLRSYLNPGNATAQRKTILDKQP